MSAPKTHTVAVDLPLTYYKGIGKVIQAHALLELCVSEVLFELMKIDYKAGRTAFAYRAASTQFTSVRHKRHGHLPSAGGIRKTRCRRYSKT
jgi:hypothetical protein